MAVRQVISLVAVGCKQLHGHILLKSNWNWSNRGRSDGSKKTRTAIEGAETYTSLELAE